MQNSPGIKKKEKEGKGGEGKGAPGTPYCSPPGCEESRICPARRTGWSSLYTTEGKRQRC